MSDAGEGERPPDLAAALIGYRIWMLGVNGTLGAIAAGSIWSPGVNRAVCCPSVAPERRPQHSAPHFGCVCGFNAFAGLDGNLRASSTTALGAIAAWGEVDIYRTGFRAEYAQVVALAIPRAGGGGRATALGRERLERAAERYSVPLVPRARLEAEALLHGSAVPPTLLPEPARHPQAPPPSPPPKRRRRTRRGRSSAPSGRPAVETWDDARGHAVWVSRHVSLRCRQDVIELGPAPGATALLGPEPDVRAIGLGGRVEAGGVVAAIATVYPGRSLHLLSPVGGTISALNPGFSAGLLAGDIGLATAPWLAGIRPDATSPLDDAPLLWGRPGAELYRRGVLGRSDADVLAELEPPRGPDLGALVPLRQAPAALVGLVPLGAHQRVRTSLPPERGRRAAIMVGELRPLLQAVGGVEAEDLRLA